jgi:hypothetical protein
MVQRRRQNSEQGQAAIILALAMIGLLATVGLALDGGMVYWNQRRAQNGADAAAISGTTALVNQVLAKNYNCAASTEEPILDLVEQYTQNNEVPEGEDNVQAFYLVEDYATKRRFDLINPTTGRPWAVGTTGRIPCSTEIGANNDLAGIHVKATFPQDTFLAGVIGIAETQVTVDAYAIYEHRTWCTDFAVYALQTACNQNAIHISGASDSVTGGGIHSNSGLHLGGGGQGITLEAGRPVEYQAGCGTAINTGNITGGPNPSAPDLGIAGTEPTTLPDDFFYEFEDFAPGGFIAAEIPASMYHYFPASTYPNGIGNNEVTNTDGTLRDGLYVVESGDVKLNNLSQSANAAPWRATIVARGQVKISGGINQMPVARGIFVFTESSNMNPGAVDLSGSSNRWAGMLAAPNGSVSMSGARNSDLAGMIIGQTVDMTGSDNSIHHRPEFCPMNPPRVLLVN